MDVGMAVVALATTARNATVPGVSTSGRELPGIGGT
jgi:hypothetical protein